MNRGFHIQFRRSVGNLHISISGEFSDMCAWELIKTIHRQPLGAGRIFVNTADIGSVLPTGIELFKCHMTRTKLPSDWLYFKGEKGFSIAPDGSRVIVNNKSNDRLRFRGCQDKESLRRS